MKIFIGAIFVSLLFAICGFSQAAIDPAKKELIHQFAALTHSNEIDFNATFSADGLKQKFSGLIDSDKQLNETQKAELQTSADNAINRINTAWKTKFEGDPSYQQLGIESAFEIYDKAFSTAELKDLIAFYSSPLGTKAVAFLGSVRTEIGNSFLQKAKLKMEEQIQPLINAETDALTKKIKDAEKPGM